VGDTARGDDWVGGWGEGVGGGGGRERNRISIRGDEAGCQGAVQKSGATRTLLGASQREGALRKFGVEHCPAKQREAKQRYDQT
jgi:hypothetical protein